MQGASILTMAERVRRENPAARCVLALDLGSRMGWAIQHLDGHISSGTALFEKRGGEGHRWRRVRAWLTELKNAHGGIDALYYERVNFVKTTEQARTIFGCEATVTAWAEAHEVATYDGIPTNVLKQHATGKGNADKAAMIAAVEALGYQPRDSDEADALALLHLGLERMKEAA